MGRQDAEETPKSTVIVTTSEKVLDTELLPKISIKTLKIVLVETDENADENLVEDESVREKINTKGLESSAKEITLTTGH